MPRNPSTILSAAEAKVVDLDKEIKAAEKEAAKLGKEIEKLKAKRDKAAAPKKPRAKKLPPIETLPNYPGTVIAGDYP